MSVYKVTLNESEIYLLEEAIDRMLADLDAEEEAYETDLTESKLDYKKILKRFSENEKSICTYDKIHCKRYNASLMSVCCEDDLYTISDNYVKNNKINEDEYREIVQQLGYDTHHITHLLNVSSYEQYQLIIQAKHKGVIQLEKKDDMKERGLSSPDRADALVMAWYGGRFTNYDDTPIERAESPRPRFVI